MYFIAQDLSFSVRTLARTPVLTTAAMAMLAVGIGANSAIFAVINNAAFNTFPWEATDRLVSVTVRSTERGGRQTDPFPAHVAEWQRRTNSFEGITAFEGARMHLTHHGERQPILAARVLPNGPRLAGVTPLLGRTFSDADSEPEAAPTVVISEQLWASRFARDADIVDQQIELDGKRFTVIGVLRSRQWFPRIDIEALLPLRISPEEVAHRVTRPLIVDAWLRPGVPLSEAQAEMDLLMRTLAAANPTTDSGLSVQLRSLPETALPQPVRYGLFLLWIAVALVLLIICANLANLFLTHVSDRQKEFATRIAVGAAPVDIVRQLLIQCACIGVVAMPLSALFAHWTLQAARGVVPDRVAFFRVVFQLDAGAALYGFALAVAAVVLVGLLPAFQASRLRIAQVLGEGGTRGSTGGALHRSMQRALVVGQIALAFSLLLVAGVLSRSFEGLRAQELGFRTADTLVAATELADSEAQARSLQRSLQAELVSEVARVPGIDLAAVTSLAPLGWAPEMLSFEVRGQALRPGSETGWSAVSSSYFETLGLEVRSGRRFTVQDSMDSEPVAAVTEEFVRRFLEGGVALDQRVRLGKGDAVERRIVAVIADAADFNGFEHRKLPHVYVPFAQSPSRILHVVAQSSDPGAVVDEVRTAIRGVSRSLALRSIRTMQERLRLKTWTSTLLAQQMSTLGGLALLLACVGVFGVVSYTTRMRMPEYGIRQALGAEPKHILALVLRQALSLAAVGACLGGALAVLLVKLIRGLFFGIASLEAVAAIGTLGLLVGVVLLAALQPAAKAVRAEPVDALRGK